MVLLEHPLYLDLEGPRDETSVVPEPVGVVESLMAVERGKGRKEGSRAGRVE